jgi:hypothetical protein
MEMPAYGEFDNDEYTDRKCYEFNAYLEPALDDGRCVHCRKFFTLECEYIDEFIEEEEVE